MSLKGLFKKRTETDRVLPSLTIVCSNCGLAVASSPCRTCGSEFARRVERRSGG